MNNHPLVLVICRAFIREDHPVAVELIHHLIPSVSFRGFDIPLCKPFYDENGNLKNDMEPFESRYPQGGWKSSWWDIDTYRRWFSLSFGDLPPVDKSSLGTATFFSNIGNRALYIHTEHFPRNRVMFSQRRFRFDSNWEFGYCTDLSQRYSFG